jgi:hypothetical protein
MADLDMRGRRLMTMLSWRLQAERSGSRDLDAFFAALWAEPAVREDLVEMLEAVDQRSTTRGRPSGLPPEIPLSLHARYSRAEVIGALGFAEGVKPTTTQGGILWVPQADSDVFFIDLHKAERDYSPTTMYRDYAVSRDLFHWESQSRQHEDQPTVKRYINHERGGTRVLLFVRERKDPSWERQRSHSSDRCATSSTRASGRSRSPGDSPNPMPESLFEIARSVAAA